jgi:YHS domain-containing protein
MFTRKCGWCGKSIPKNKLKESHYKKHYDYFCSDKCFKKYDEAETAEQIMRRLKNT